MARQRSFDREQRTREEQRAEQPQKQQRTQDERPGKDELRQAQRDERAQETEHVRTRETTEQREAVERGERDTSPLRPALDDPAALDDATKPEPTTAPAPDAPTTTSPTTGALTEPPAGATIWENRSGVEGSGYYEMQGPDIAFADGVWYYETEQGTWQAFHEGDVLNFYEITAPISVEALQYEITSGTSMFGAGRPSDYNMTLHGPTGDLVTENGLTIDPHDLELLRASDGTVVWLDTSTGRWSSGNDFDVTIADPPPGPYTTLARGEGMAPPLDELGASQSFVFDADTLRYHDGPGGVVVGFHQSQFDELRVWENRSDQPDSEYQDMQGPANITYHDGVWFAYTEQGTYQVIHEGEVLDFYNYSGAASLEALQFELLAGTPLFGEGLPSDWGLRLDGESGQLIDEDGNPIDLHTWDPYSPVDDDVEELSDAEGEAEPELAPVDAEVGVDQDTDESDRSAEQDDAAGDERLLERDTMDLQFGRGARPALDRGIDEATHLPRVDAIRAREAAVEPHPKGSPDSELRTPPERPTDVFEVDPLVDDARIHAATDEPDRYEDAELANDARAEDQFEDTLD